jgi:hypothetical protein
LLFGGANRIQFANLAMRADSSPEARKAAGGTHCILAEHSLKSDISGLNTTHFADSVSRGATEWVLAG